MQSVVGKSQEHHHRLTRLTDGREAVRLGTEVQRMHTIKRFEEEVRKTPQRKKLYQDAIDKALEDGVELETSSTDVEGDNPSSMIEDVDGKVDRSQHGSGSVETKVSSSSQATEEDDDVLFAREMELAIKLSLEANGQSQR